MRITRRQLRRIINEETRRLSEQDDTLAGDLEAAEGDLADAEGALSVIEDNAMVAIKAIYDLAAAAGVELEADVSGPSDMEFDGEVEVDEVEEDKDDALSEELKKRMPAAWKQILGDILD